MILASYMLTIISVKGHFMLCGTENGNVLRKREESFRVRLFTEEWTLMRLSGLT
jgi:hypothetical protein